MWSWIKKSKNVSRHGAEHNPLDYYLQKPVSQYCGAECAKSNQEGKKIISTILFEFIVSPSCVQQMPLDFELAFVLVPGGGSLLTSLWHDMLRYIFKLLLHLYYYTFRLIVVIASCLIIPECIDKWICRRGIKAAAQIQSKYPLLTENAWNFWVISGICFGKSKGFRRFKVMLSSFVINHINLSQNSIKLKF